MKNIFVKSAFAASALILAGAAHAQSSVTMYGILDTAIVYQSHDNGPGKYIGLTDSGAMPSLWGMRGTEDLGGGLHADFDLESGLNMANGGFNDSNNNLFGRQAWVGLSGGFGSMRAGLQYSPMFDAVFALDPRDLSQLGSDLPLFVNEAAASGIFVSDALRYDSPDIAGFKASLMYAPGGVAGNFQAGRELSGSVSYHMAGAGLYAGYYNALPGANGMPNVSGDFHEIDYVLGATYKAGPATFKASFLKHMGPTLGDALATETAGAPLGVASDNIYSLGADFHATPALDLNGGVYYVVDRDNTASKTLMGALGATYNLSKRTAVYVQAGVVNNKGTQNQGIEMGEQGGVVNTVFAPAGTTVSADVGIHHMF